MQTLTRAIAAGAFLVSISIIVLADNPSGSGSYRGDPLRGAKIAAWGTSNGVASCASCHSYDGVGNGPSAVPRLAGQTAAYLTQQLDKFAARRRHNVYMTNFAQRLNPQERADVSAYYASLQSPFPPPNDQFTAEQLERGRQLATLGDDKLTVPSCNNCHGPDGVGESPDIPALKGQYSNFIVYRLEQFTAGHNDADLMFPIAAALRPEDMNAVAAYFERLGLSTSKPSNPEKIANTSSD
jgi:cytochrome c553